MKRKIKTLKRVGSLAHGSALLPSEMAQMLCEEIERYPASEQQTKCSLLASQLRKELEIYEETRPMTPDENELIEKATKQFMAVTPNTTPEENDDSPSAGNYWDR